MTEAPCAHCGHLLDRHEIWMRAKALVDALDACIPEINNTALLAGVHGHKYEGPTFGQELEALRKALGE